MADYGMVWVGDDAADSDYDILEESPSSIPSNLQAVWKPGKILKCFHLKKNYKVFDFEKK